MFDFDTFGGVGLFTVFNINICQPLDIVLKVSMCYSGWAHLNNSQIYYFIAIMSFYITLTITGNEIKEAIGKQRAIFCPKTASNWQNL